MARGVTNRLAAANVSIDNLENDETLPDEVAYQMAVDHLPTMAARITH